MNSRAAWAALDHLMKQAMFNCETQLDRWSVLNFFCAKFLSLIAWRFCKAPFVVSHMQGADEWRRRPGHRLPYVPSQHAVSDHHLVSSVSRFPEHHRCALDLRRGRTSHKKAVEMSWTTTQ